MSTLLFLNPMAWIYGGLVSGCLLVLFATVQRRTGRPVHRIVALTCLRGFTFLALVTLMARPVWTESDEDAERRNDVVVLFDRSESMSLQDGPKSRYGQALEFARDQLLPTLVDAGVNVRAVLFAEDSTDASGSELAETTPDGGATNLSRAIAAGVAQSASPPLAIIALSDGAANVETENQRAASTLVTFGVPFVGLGFGSETGGQTIGIETVSGPAMVSPNQSFRISARLRFQGVRLPACKLLLLRDGQLIDRLEIAGLEEPQLWQESFEVTEDGEGTHTYSVQLLPPTAGAVKATVSESSHTVRIASARDLRVLYLQGGLTWDYKFIQLALRNDPTIKLSGLSRTASTSRFFENVQNDISLVGGFPDSLEKLGEFRVVILSNLRPGDLSPSQQELLARFCGEQGGGILMIGGPETFNGNWRGSRLEQLLPVRFDAFSAPKRDQPFRIRLTESALRNAVFQISEQSSVRTAWDALPMFSNAARVAGVKPGAEVWLEHGQPSGEQRPVLMATQRFGNGVSTVLCMQNCWRWRLAKESNPEHYDRFWQQLLRYLSEAGPESVSITLADQRLAVGQPVLLTVERMADPSATSGTADSYQVLLRDESQREVDRQTVNLEAGQSLDVTFQPESEGTYTATVLDKTQSAAAIRSFDLRAIKDELTRTAARMDILRQWAGLSGGFAERAEECDQLEERLNEVLDRAGNDIRTRPYPVPAGINGWSLALLLSLIGTEWILRKRWRMT